MHQVRSTVGVGRQRPILSPRARVPRSPPPKSYPVALVIPELKGKFHGFAVRVPTPTVSMVDFTVQFNKAASVEAINNALIEASESEALEGILGVSHRDPVSSDFIGDTRSSIVDLQLTIGMGDDFFKIVTWYDNEWGYSVRISDLAAYLADNF